MINCVRKGTQGQSCTSKLQKTNPLVITLQLSRYPARTLGEYIRKWRLEQGLLQVPKTEIEILISSLSLDGRGLG